MRVRVGLSETDGSKDQIIYDTIKTAIGIIETYLDRGIISDNEQEHFTHVDASAIQLYRYPLTDGVTITMSPELKYHVDKKNGIIFFDGHVTEHTLTIDYEGGYLTDFMPVALHTAVLRVFDVLGLDFDTKASIGDVGGISRISVPDVGTIAYATKSAAGTGENDFIDNTTKFLLDPWKKRVV